MARSDANKLIQMLVDPSMIGLEDHMRCCNCRWSVEFKDKEKYPDVLACASGPPTMQIIVDKVFSMMARVRSRGTCGNWMAKIHKPEPEPGRKLDLDPDDGEE